MATKKKKTEKTTVTTKAPKRQELRVVIYQAKETATLLLNSAQGLRATLKEQREIISITGEPEPPKVGGKKTRRPSNPLASYNKARYRFSEKQDGYPAHALKRCLIDTAFTFINIPRKLVKGTVEMVPEDGFLFPLFHDRFPPLLHEGIEIVGPWDNRVPDLRWRPIYVNWWIPITLVHDPNQISVNNMFNLILRAGVEIGIGEHRTGKFSVATPEEWEIKCKQHNKYGIPMFMKNQVYLPETGELADPILEIA